MGQFYRLSGLFGDLWGLVRLARADLRPARADLRFGKALKVTKSCRIQGFEGFLWLFVGLMRKI